MKPIEYLLGNSPHALSSQVFRAFYNFSMPSVSVGNTLAKYSALQIVKEAIRDDVAMLLVFLAGRGEEHLTKCV